MYQDFKLHCISKWNVFTFKIVLGVLIKSVNVLSVIAFRRGWSWTQDWIKFSLLFVKLSQIWWSTAWNTQHWVPIWIKKLRFIGTISPDESPQVKSTKVAFCTCPVAMKIWWTILMNWMKILSKIKSNIFYVLQFLFWPLYLITTTFGITFLFCQITRTWWHIVK